MGLKIIIENPGMLTTVQDLGRFGYQKFGMPVAGAMDAYALQAANTILGNKRNEGVLEITFPGLILTFEGEGFISITGADLGANFNGQLIKSWQSFAVKSGDRLHFTSADKGCRAYLAVQGGFRLPLVLGSKSTYLRGKIGGFQGRKLLKGDILEAEELSTFGNLDYTVIPEEFIPDYDRRIIGVILGPQEEYFPQKEIVKFLSSPYQLTGQYDRMGYRLEGLPLQHIKGADIISDGIAPGAIQVAGEGQPIIMLADRQTIGGYTKIANVISADLPLLAQLVPGDKINFKMVSIEEAHELLRKQEDKLLRLANILN